MTKTAVITGAARNIGKGVAKGLLQDGYNCILLDKDKVVLHESLEELKKLGTCYEYVIDIGDSRAIDGFIQWLRESNILVEVLVNNAAFESEDTLTTLTSDSIIKSNKVNLEGPFYLTSGITQYMIENGVKGNVIFVTSTHSRVTRMHPLYSSAKAATEMFMKEAALELAPYEIRVNAIAPGPVKDSKEPESSTFVPLGFTLQPKDIAASIVFLISDGARFVTAQTLVVDGGFSEAHTHYWLKHHKLP